MDDVDGGVEQAMRTIPHGRELNRAAWDALDDEDREVLGSPEEWDWDSAIRVARDPTVSANTHSALCALFADLPYFTVDTLDTARESGKDPEELVAMDALAPEFCYEDDCDAPVVEGSDWCSEHQCHCVTCGVAIGDGEDYCGACALLLSRITGARVRYEADLTDSQMDAVRAFAARLQLTGS